MLQVYRETDSLKPASTGLGGYMVELQTQYNCSQHVILVVGQYYDVNIS